LLESEKLAPNITPLNWRFILAFAVIWFITNVVIVQRIETYGAFSTFETSKLFEYAKSNYHTDPGSLRLNQSYTRWALNLLPSDAYNYLRAGLGVADGRGLNIKMISPKDPTSHKYLPYYHQGPGTPVSIGTFIKLFGQESVWPYFLFISTIHFMTALCVCYFARLFLKNERYIYGAGLLSLLCLPAIDSNLGAGLFWSEPLAAPCVLLGLIAVGVFWKRVESLSCSLKIACLAGLGFGGSLGIASYFRDVYTSFAQFSALVLLLAGLSHRKSIRQIALFTLTAMLAITLVQYPWKKRNNWYFREFSMSGATYCSSGLWALTWDKTRAAIPGYEGGIGLGDYLLPDKSTEVLQTLDRDKKIGSNLAFKYLIEGICKHPVQAIMFKLEVYDSLWLGQTAYPVIYIACLISTLSFFASVISTRFRFQPALWFFPAYLVCISTLIQYEHRYSQPFFLFVTPVTTMVLIETIMARRKKSELEPEAQDQLHEHTAVVTSNF
jgi:hypothetical protein